VEWKISFIIIFGSLGYKQRQCIINNTHKTAHTHENMHARIDFVLYKSWMTFLNQWRIRIKIKNKNTVRTIPKSNGQFVETETRQMPITHI